MFRVLLVDDEPLVLAGVKFIIQWESCDCQLVGTARNGRQALEVIEEVAPDIVVADINMPVMNGMELLEICQVKYPHIVFIFLTNIQEFELAREALRLHAVDYIMKSQLEPDVLEKSLIMAKREVERRVRLKRVDLVDTYLRENQQERLERGIRRFLSAGVFNKEGETLFLEQGLEKGYGWIEIWLWAEKEINYGNNLDWKRLFPWQKEIVQKITASYFEEFILLEPEHNQSLWVFFWGEKKFSPDKYADFLEEYSGRLVSTSKALTRIQVKILATPIYEDIEERDNCQKCMQLLRDHLYLDVSHQQFFDLSSIPHTKFQPLGLHGTGGKLKTEIHSKNLPGCLALMDRISSQIRTVDHERSQGLWQCSEIYGNGSKTLEQIIGTDRLQPFFSDTTEGYQQIEKLITRQQVMDWLEVFSAEISQALHSISKDRSSLVEKAKYYIWNNVDKKLTLQEVADQVSISSGYLSALFKKEYGQNFVEFVNQAKIEKACQLILQDSMLMSEISYQLGYENSYYFSKVFRKHMGITPTEYRRQQRAGATKDPMDQ